MAGCCSIDPYIHFENIINGDGPLEIATAFHLSSYGDLTALVQSEYSKKKINQFFDDFQAFIEENSEMPWNIEELEDDMHLILFSGTITFDRNNKVTIDDKEIYGKRIFSKMDTLERSGLLKQPIQIESGKELYNKISKSLWLLHPIDGQPHETIWKKAEDFASFIVKGEI
ncbi:hypothetical protein [Terrihalobacillus insolitus]|uniref:hypothetical protein n=1 Tax=Terrihalobacillus insolitus TaxID=2950438 RepID=UPI00233F9721|nr:hypothetical protein [Terrihalobacillus insolitus]MDC3415200.1 hypothetical protein [Terrihalobacillus insolitus]